MDFEFSEKSLRMQKAVRSFIEQYVTPLDPEYTRVVEHEHVFPPPFLEDLKAKARAQGLWNLFLPGLKPDEPGTQMSNLDYAPCAGCTGPRKSSIAARPTPGTWNCCTWPRRPRRRSVG